MTKPKQPLRDKTEALILLCTKSSTYWSNIKLMFSLPLILTSSAMLIINSISSNPADIKYPNIVVNGISVLLISLNNQFRAAEKVEVFKKITLNLLKLQNEIEYIEGPTIEIEQYRTLLLMYENIVKDICFEDVPEKYKIQIVDIFTKNNKALPLQLSGNLININMLKRASRYSGSFFIENPKKKKSTIIQTHDINENVVDA